MAAPRPQDANFYRDYPVEDVQVDFKLNDENRSDENHLRRQFDHKALLKPFHGLAPAKCQRGPNSLFTSVAIAMGLGYSSADLNFYSMDLRERCLAELEAYADYYAMRVMHSIICTNFCFSEPKFTTPKSDELLPLVTDHLHKFLQPYCPGKDIKDQAKEAFESGLADTDPNTGHPFLYNPEPEADDDLDKIKKLYCAERIFAAEIRALVQDYKKNMGKRPARLFHPALASVINRHIKVVMSTEKASDPVCHPRNLVNDTPPPTSPQWYTYYHLRHIYNQLYRRQEEFVPRYGPVEPSREWEARTICLLWGPSHRLRSKGMQQGLRQYFPLMQVTSLIPDFSS